MSRTCTQCSRPLPDEAAYCSHCGSFVGTMEERRRNVPEAGPWEAILEKLRTVAAPKYRVHRLLGYGGMAGVYLAEEPRLGRRVAIKLISPSLMMDPSLVERFLQEARTTAKLGHPNIVTIFDIDEKEGLHYFAMSYVPGRTLGHVMAESVAPLPVPVVRAWLTQVSEALAYAHRAGVVHRDIKPGNILLNGEGNALVTDFGIAKVGDAPGLTRTGMLVGTPAYMSPEQCGGSEVAGASDQYSLGAVAYQMITGQPPFTGPTLAVIQAHMGKRPRAIGELRPDCPSDLQEVVARMLEKEPDARWPDMEAVIVALGTEPLRHSDPVRLQMTELAAWTRALTIASDRGIRRRPTPSDPIPEGDRFVLAAVPRDETGRVLTNRRVEWSVEPAGVVEVDEKGRARALASGDARITATCGGVTDDVVVTVVGEAAEAPAAVPVEAPPAPEATAPLEDEPAPPPRLEEPATPPMGATEVVSRLRSDAPAATPRGADPALTPSTRPAAPRPADSPWPSSRRWLGVAGGLVGAAALLAAILFVTRDTGPDPQEGQDLVGPVQPVPTTPAPGPSPGPEGDPLGPAGEPTDAAGEEPDPGPLATATPERPPAGEPAPARDPPATTPTPAPAEPAPGVLQLAGQVPPGAQVTATGPDGVVRRFQNGSLSLPPGTYRVDVRAEGFQPASQSVRVQAGRTVRWAPSLERVAAAPTEPAPQPAAAEPPAVEPAPAEPAPAARAAADAAAITEAVRAFGDALQSRDIGNVRQAYPSIPQADADRWRQFIESRQIRDLRVSVELPEAPAVQGDRAEVGFLMRLDYRNPAAPPPDRPLRYRAVLTRSGGVWVIQQMAPEGG